MRALVTIILRSGCAQAQAAPCNASTIYRPLEICTPIIVQLSLPRYAESAGGVSACASAADEGSAGGAASAAGAGSAGNAGLAASAGSAGGAGLAAGAGSASGAGIAAGAGSAGGACSAADAVDAFSLTASARLSGMGGSGALRLGGAGKAVSPARTTLAGDSSEEPPAPSRESRAFPLPLCAARWVW